MHWEIVPRERLQKCWLGWDCGFFLRVRYRSNAANGDWWANMYEVLILKAMELDRRLLRFHEPTRPVAEDVRYRRNSGKHLPS
jgi:hypothetical protein